jgi:hypothetical protein
MRLDEDNLENEGDLVDHRNSDIAKGSRKLEKRGTIFVVAFFEYNTTK